MKNLSSTRKKVLFFFVLPIILSNSLNLFGQNDYLKLINDQLNYLVNLAEQRGNRREYSNGTDKLNQGYHHSYNTNLESGKTYFFFGVCDKDCSDLDIVMLDSNDRIIASDTEPNDKPIIQINSPQTGQYKLQVKMVTCKASPCYYGFTSVSKSVVQQLREQISLQLDKQKETALEKSGMVKTHNYLIDSINKPPTDEVAKHSETFDLTRGMTYMFAGVCDQDCTDLDIKIFNPRGKVIASDTTPDDLPALIVKPQVTGIYRVEITMYKCNKYPCWYGVGVFGK